MPGLNSGLQQSDFKAGRSRFGWYLPQGHIDAFKGGKATVVTLPARFKLFKLTKGEIVVDPTYGISPWWSSVMPYREDDEGAIGRYEQAKLNKIDLSSMVRYMSAVCIDWNALDNYIEVSLKQEVSCFWGLFAPQKSWGDGRKKNLAVEMSFSKTSDSSRKMGIKDAVMPDDLGALDAWQLYIPGLTDDYVNRNERVLNAHDMVVLEQHFFG